MVGTANKTGNYGEDLFVTNHFNLAKGLYSRDQVTYEGDPFGVVGSSWKKILPKDSKSYIAEIPKSELTSLTELDPMIFKNRGAIPTTNVRFLKENWLRGYKEIKAK